MKRIIFIKKDYRSNAKIFDKIIIIVIIVIVKKHLNKTKMILLKNILANENEKLFILKNVILKINVVDIINYIEVEL